MVDSFLKRNTVAASSNASSWPGGHLLSNPKNFRSGSWFRLRLNRLPRFLFGGNLLPDLKSEWRRYSPCNRRSIAENLRGIVARIGQRTAPSTKVRSNVLIGTTESADNSFMWRRRSTGGPWAAVGDPRDPGRLCRGRSTTGTSWRRRIRRASSTTRTVGFGGSP
jgi:hypothetical protein